VSARAVVALAFGLIALQPCAAQYGFRSLTGTVTDKRGNALPDARVQLEDKKDLTVRTFLTDRNGRYYFNNLNDNIDYTLFVKYRKWRSGTKTISRFDSSGHPKVDLTIPVD
jgi:hypothetical protein